MSSLTCWHSSLADCVTEPLDSAPASTLPKQVQEESAERNLRPHLTAPVTLQLATARAVQLGLTMFGIEWIDPRKVLPGETSTSTASGLYAWVDGVGAPGLPDADAIADLDRPVLYWGIGEDKKKGVRGRLANEWSWIGEAAGHGHGRAMHRRRAFPLVGPVTFKQGQDRSGLYAALNENAAEAEEAVLDWLGNGPSPEQVAERLAIRLSIHLGDTGAPVQSTYAGAWDSLHGADWAAWAIAKILTQ